MEVFPLIIAIARGEQPLSALHAAWPNCKISTTAALLARLQRARRFTAGTIMAEHRLLRVSRDEIDPGRLYLVIESGATFEAMALLNGADAKESINRPHVRVYSVSRL